MLSTFYPRSPRNSPSTSVTGLTNVTGQSPRSSSPTPKRSESLGAMGTFAVHSDALYREIEIAQKNIGKGNVTIADASQLRSEAKEETSFFGYFSFEVERISDYIKAQQDNVEHFAKALLVNLEAAFGNGSDPAYFQYYRNTAADLAETCLKLQQFKALNRQLLIDVGACAEYKLGTSCQSLLQRRFEDAPWLPGPESAFVVILSDIYETIRVAEKSLYEKSLKGSQQWVAPSAFERSTTKYWVKEDHLTDLLLACVSEAPLLVYGRSGNLTSKEECLSRHSETDKLWGQLASQITSVYFDSPNMSLYKERLARREGAQLLRARWYGAKPSGAKPIFLELKTHHEKWINTKSVKERVEIREEDMPSFLARKPWTVVDAQEMVLACKPTMKEDDLAKAAGLLLRMHELVLKHDLRPCVRSVYLRAAFQSSESNSLRLTVDRNVTLIDETKNSTESWCLPDDAKIEQSMAYQVPFVVFEIKLANDEGMPMSLQNLETHSIIQEAAKFSKFLTGAAAFNASKITTLPYWAANPAFAKLYQKPECSDKTQPLERSDRTLQTELSSSRALSFYSKTEDLQGWNAATVERVDLSSKPSSDWKKQDPQAWNAGGGDVGPWSVTGQPHSRKTPRNFLKRKSAAEGEEGFSGRPWRRLFGSSGGGEKKIAPQKAARVEPKSYFANERTFIQWLSASLFLVTLAVILLGYDNGVTTGNDSSVARNCGIGVSCGAVLIALYSSFVYFRRLKLLASGSAYGYVDHVGPFVLAFAVAIGVLVMVGEFTAIDQVLRDSKEIVLREEPGQCFMHSNEGISMLEYQPSSVIVDTKRNLLLVASKQEIIGHSMAPASESNDQSQNAVKKLVEIPQSDLEGLTTVGDRLFALSEGPEKPELIELSWSSSDESLDVVSRWRLGDSSGQSQAEGITFIPRLSSVPDTKKGRLLIDVDGVIYSYDVPAADSASRLAVSALPATLSSVPSELGVQVSVNGNGANTTAVSDRPSLERLSSLNMDLINSKSKMDPKIAELHFFEGVAYMLHDNDMVLRAWDLTRGVLLSETPLPHVADGYSRQWEGFFLERRPLSKIAESGYFLGKNESTVSDLRDTLSLDEDTVLVAHMTLDTPPQVWSILVEEGPVPGSIVFPPCAAARHFVPHSLRGTNNALP